MTPNIIEKENFSMKLPEVHEDQTCEFYLIEYEKPDTFYNMGNEIEFDSNIKNYENEIIKNDYRQEKMKKNVKVNVKKDQFIENEKKKENNCIYVIIIILICLLFLVLIGLAIGLPVVLTLNNQNN